MDKQELEELQALLNADEEAEEDTGKSGIDFARLAKILWSKRKYYFISIPISAVIAILFSLSIPKTYRVNVVLAPEISSALGSGSGLSSMMKNFGLSSSIQSDDAILPNLYPNLMNSQLFQASLFDIPVVSRDGVINTTYYNYLDRYQKRPVWAPVMGFFRSLIPKFDSEDDDIIVVPKAKTAANKDKAKSKKRFHTLSLNKRQVAIADAIAQNVVCDVDKKTYVISIIVTDQDPLICATVADSACQRLQDFITEYRTKKAQIEYDHALEQCQLARGEYEKAKANVAAFNDANWDIVDDEFIVQKQTLQNEMQLRFSAFSTMNTQLLAARAKLDEARPIFTVLDGASIPLEPSAPQKKKIVLVFVFLVCVVQTAWLLRKDLFKKKEETEAQTEQVAN